MNRNLNAHNGPSGLCAQLTRRQLARVAAGSLAAASALAQTAAPDTDLDKTRESHRQNSQTLAKFDIPMSLEPAFQFKA